jgi:osmoprotectant transport system ATP-binding protein
MMLRPGLLLLDEPFAAIDPLTRRDIHAQLLSLHAAEPVTSILVTHDMNEALLLADDIVVMDAGSILGTYARTTLQERAKGQDANLILMSLMQESIQ